MSSASQGAGRPMLARAGLAVFVVALIAAVFTAPNLTTTGRVGLGLIVLGGLMAIGATGYWLFDLTDSPPGRVWLALLPTILLVAGLVSGAPITFLTVLVGDVVYIIGVRGYLKRPAVRSGTEDA